MSFRVDRIDHVEVFVRDLDAAVAWYRDTLGLEEVRRWDPDPVLIGDGQTMLALFRDRGTGEPAPPALGNFRRVAWRVDAAGFDAAQQHLESLEIPFDGPIDHDISWSIYFRDPDGHLLEITTYDRD